MRRTIALALATGLSATLLVPAAASAQPNIIPPVQSQILPCAQVKSEYRQTVSSAREIRKEALRAARSVKERQTRKANKRAARESYKLTIKTAKRERRSGLEDCR